MGVRGAMVESREPSMPGGVGERLTALVSGNDPKSRWLLAGIFVSALVVGFVSPYLGWRLSRMRMVLGVSAFWFLIALVIAFRESRNSS
jgi:hypothetical protein